MDNKQRLLDIQNRVKSKSKEYDFLENWHYLMINYGWIPFKEFKKMDAYIVNELIIKCNEMNKQNKNSLFPGRRGMK